MMDIVRELIRLVVTDVFTSAGERFFNRRRDGRNPNTVAYGWGMLTLGGIGALIFVPFFAVLMLIDMPDKIAGLWAMRVIFGGVALMSLGTFIDGLFRRIEWSETGVTLRSLRGRRQVKWSEIEGVDYKYYLKHWRIALPGGAGFAFAKSMTGSHAFLNSAIRRGIPVTSEGEPVTDFG